MPHINDLPFAQALQIYKQMRQAVLEDDETTLAKLKTEYPSLFEEETAQLLRITVQRVNQLTGKKDKHSEH